MTDFIHEHPKNEADVPAPKPAEEETDMDEKTGQKRVYGYILILFVVAFFLLLWSFLMNQRSNEQVLSELRGNASTLQSTLDRNIALEQRIAELEQQVKALEDKTEALEAEAKALENDKAQLEQERDALKDELQRAQTELAALQAAQTEEQP